MPVYTIVCPDCGHVAKSLVLKGARMPTRMDVLGMRRPPRAARSRKAFPSPILGRAGMVPVVPVAAAEQEDICKNKGDFHAPMRRDERWISSPRKGLIRPS